MELFTAIDDNDIHTADLLIRSGRFNLNIPVVHWTTELDTYLELAIRNNNIDMVRLLLDNGSEINGIKRSGHHPPLVFACMSKCNMDILDLLLGRGADPNIPSYNGNTAIIYTGRSPLRTRMLLDRGADVNMDLGHGNIILHILMTVCSHAVMDVHVAYGADLRGIPTKKYADIIARLSKSSLFSSYQSQYVDVTICCRS